MYNGTVSAWYTREIDYIGLQRSSGVNMKDLYVA